jgi:hypothetical protein
MKKFLFFIPILLVSCLNSGQVDKETLPITSVDSTKEEVFFIDSSSTTNGDGDGSSGGSYSDNNEIHDDSVYTESSNESNVDLGRILYVVPDTMYVMKNYEIVIRI